MASVYQLDTGEWRAVMRHRGSPTASKIFRLKADADAWGEKQEERRRGGYTVRLADARATTVADLIEQYRREVIPHRKGHEADDLRARAMLELPFSQLNLTDDIAAALRRYRDERLQTVAASTVNRDLNFLGPIFKLAIQEWGAPLASNPVKMVKRPKVSGDLRGALWKPADVQAMLTHLGWRDDVHPGLVFKSDDPQRQRVDNVYGYLGWLFQMLLYTGQRLKDVAAMRVGWIDLPNKVIHYPEGVVKNGETYDHPLNPMARALLTKYLAYRLEGKPAHAHKGLTLFPSTPHTLTNQLRLERDELAKTYPAITTLRVHDLRHTYTTDYVKRVGLKKTAQDVLKLTGRKTMQSLARYYHVDASENADVGYEDEAQAAAA